MLKTFLLTTGKLALAVLLLGWLHQSGQLDFAQLRLYQEDMTLLVATILFFLVCLVGLGTWRWKTLLEGAGYSIDWARAITLQWTGFFFNSVMPGAVGGDIIKIAYVIRDNPTRSKSQVMMTALLDRIVGLAGLFLICWIMILFNLETVRDLNGFRSMLFLITGVTAGFAVFFFAALYHYRGQDPFLALFKWRIPGIHFVEKLYNSLRVYRYARGSIVKSLLISIVIQLGSLVLFYYITTKVTTGLPSFGTLAVIYPIGVTTTAIPITPAGLGVGHVAFDQLFQMVGLDHGANAFNLYALSQLFLNLTGIIPYLSLKKIPMRELEASTHEAEKA